MRRYVPLASFLLLCQVGTVHVTVNRSSRQLLVDGQQFFARGVCYSPVPVGESYGDWLGAASASVWIQDLDLMQAMNLNVLRVQGFGHSNHTPFLDACYARGLLVAVTLDYPEDLDYADAAARDEWKKLAVELAGRYGSHPAVLLWAFGNGKNFQADNDQKRRNHLSYVSEVRAAIHQEEAAAGIWHPLCSPLMDSYLSEYFALEKSYPNAVDLWCLNLYRGSTFGPLFDSYPSTLPLMVTEYGADAYDNSKQREWDTEQSSALVALSTELRDLRRVVAGGMIFAFQDEWWRCGAVDGHDACGAHFGGLKDNFANFEWWGLYATGPGEVPQVRLARPAVAALRQFFAAESFTSNGACRAEADLYASKYNPGHNVGAVDEIVTKYHSWSPGSGPKHHSDYNEVGLMRFPSLQLSECNMPKVLLGLMVRWISTDSVVLAYGPTDTAWSEYTTTWSSFPAFDPLERRTVTVTSADIYQRVELDVTRWWSLDGPLSIWIQPDDTVASNNDANVNFFSRESNLWSQPELRITCVLSWENWYTATTTTSTSTTTSTRRRRRRTSTTRRRRRRTTTRRRRITTTTDLIPTTTMEVPPVLPSTAEATTTRVGSQSSTTSVAYMTTVRLAEPIPVPPIVEVSTTSSVPTTSAGATSTEKSRQTATNITNESLTTTVLLAEPVPIPPVAEISGTTSSANWSTAITTSALPTSTVAMTSGTTGWANSSTAIATSAVSTTTVAMTSGTTSSANWSTAITTSAVSTTTVAMTSGTTGSANSSTAIATSDVSTSPAATPVGETTETTASSSSSVSDQSGVHPILSTTRELGTGAEATPAPTTNINTAVTSTRTSLASTSAPPDLDTTLGMVTSLTSELTGTTASPGSVVTTFTSQATGSSTGEVAGTMPGVASLPPEAIATIRASCRLKLNFRQRASELTEFLAVALAAALEVSRERILNVVVEGGRRLLAQQTDLQVSYEVQASGMEVEDLLNKVTTMGRAGSAAAKRFSGSLATDGLEVTSIQLMDVPHVYLELPDQEPPAEALRLVQILWCFLLALGASCVAGGLACGLGYVAGRLTQQPIVKEPAPKAGSSEFLSGVAATEATREERRRREMPAERTGRSPPLKVSRSRRGEPLRASSHGHERGRIKEVLL